jgi:hypothetical protein
VDIVGHLFSALLAEIIESIALEARIFTAYHAEIATAIRRMAKYPRLNRGLLDRSNDA